MSEVWNHFVMAENRQHVTCRHCSKVMKRSDSSTKSMWGHLYARHKDSVDEHCFNLKRKRRSAQKGTTTKSSSVDAKSPSDVEASSAGSNDGMSGGEIGSNTDRKGGSGDGNGHPSSFLFGTTPPLASAAVAPLPNFSFSSQLMNPLASIYPLLLAGSSTNPAQLMNEMVSRSLLGSMMNAAGWMPTTAVQQRDTVTDQSAPLQPNGGAAEPECGEVDEELVIVEDPVISPISSKRIVAHTHTPSPHNPRHSCESTLLCTIHQIACKLQLCFTADCSARRPTFHIHRSQLAGDIKGGKSLEFVEDPSSGDVLCVERHDCRLVSEERWKKDQLPKLIQAKCRGVFHSQ